MCSNVVTKTLRNSMQVKMANFATITEFLSMGVIVAKTIVLKKIIVTARDSCVDDCDQVIQSVPRHQGHSSEASCSKHATFTFFRGAKLK